MLQLLHNNKGGNKMIRGYSEEELKITRNNLSILYDEVKEGYFDGWGIDSHSILVTLSFITNLQNGIYGGKDNE